MQERTKRRLLLVGLLLRPELAEPAIWYELRKRAEVERPTAAPLPPPPPPLPPAPH